MTNLSNPIDLAQQTPIRKVGLTGSIGTGKSTVTATLKQLGVTVIDADELARRVVEPGRPALDEIRRAFGDEVFSPDGQLDRDALGRIVFTDEATRARLNEIVHPRVAQEAAEQMAAALADEPDGFVVYDVPLLFEAELEAQFDLLVVVWATREQQARRLKQRDELTEEDISHRIASQLDIEIKVRRADIVLDNRGEPGELEPQVARLVTEIRTANKQQSA